ncbi:Hypothetical predicted protein [Olea europaea subsp. europaea]|uniref:Uncharacterized protein n=1 Tax=Olea europaea subsp. europaea TaxID=158383 RepID=A0A8S0U606_OLEEU|nr:Hypothetical predicted protein [Olea europaea subsp. europaea]
MAKGAILSIVLSRLLTLEKSIENQSKKKHNHRIGSRPFSYVVEEIAEDEMLFKGYEYLVNKAKRYETWTSNL